MRLKHAGRASLILLLCAGCIAPSAPAATATPLPSAAPVATATPLPSLTPPPTPSPSPQPSLTPAPLAARVLIITIDGLRADALYRVSMPVLAGLMQRGASSLSAQTILPSATLMAHASIISASCLAKHAITWNDYRPELGETHAVTLFDLVHAAGGRTVMVVGKEKLIQIVHRGTADVFAYVAGHDRDVAARAASEMAQGFEAMLVHLPVVDGVGHTFGWMSPQQVSVIERADTAVGTLLEGLAACGVCGADVWTHAEARSSGGRRYYACSRRLRPVGHAARCSLPFVRVERLDAAVWLELVAAVSRDDLLGVVGEREAESATERPMWEADLAQAERRREQLEAAEVGILERYRRGLISEAAMDRHLRGLGRERAQLRDQAEHARQAASARSTPDPAAAVAELRRRILAPSPEERRALARTLIAPGGVVLAADGSASLSRRISRR